MPLGCSRGLSARPIALTPRQFSGGSRSCVPLETCGVPVRSIIAPARRSACRLTFSSASRASEESHILELPAQTLEAFLASKSDGAYGKAEFGRDFRIRPRGSFKEQQLHQPATLRRQQCHGFSQHLLFLRLLNEIFGDGRSGRLGKIILPVAAHHTLVVAL